MHFHVFTIPEFIACLLIPMSVGLVLGYFLRGLVASIKVRRIRAKQEQRAIEAMAKRQAAMAGHPRFAHLVSTMPVVDPRAKRGYPGKVTSND